jgi:hypothetical protein
MDQSQFDFSPCSDSAEFQRTTRGGISGRVGLDSGLLYVPREVWTGYDVPLTDSNREMFLVEKSARWGRALLVQLWRLSSTRDNQVNTEV